MTALTAVALAATPALPQQAATPEPRKLIAGEGAMLQGLNKVTARISTFSTPLDTPVRFGTLRITVRTCRSTPPEEPPERSAFLEVDDVRPGEVPRRVFTGWMFASSPSLSALEHPVYDVWVVDCMNAASSSSPSSE